MLLASFRLLSRMSGRSRRKSFLWKRCFSAHSRLLRWSGSGWRAEPGECRALLSVSYLDLKGVDTRLRMQCLTEEATFQINILVQPLPGPCCFFFFFNTDLKSYKIKYSGYGFESRVKQTTWVQIPALSLAACYINFSKFQVPGLKFITTVYLLNEITYTQLLEECPVHSSHSVVKSKGSGARFTIFESEM